MSVGEKIIELRKEHGLTRDAFANYLQIPSSTLRNYELGTREPSHLFIVQMAKIFNVSTDYLLGLSSHKTMLIDQAQETSLTQQDFNHIRKYHTLDSYGKDMVDTVLQKEYNRKYESEQAQEFIMLEPSKMIPSYQSIASVSAGTGQYVFDDIVPSLIEVDTDCKADFIISVTGDSMQPTFQDGDGLYVKKQGSVGIGEIGIFMINHEAYVKELGDQILISHNPAYPAIALNDTCWCVGKVIGKVS